MTISLFSHSGLLFWATLYSELTACNPTFPLTRWLQQRYKQSRLCVTEQWQRQTRA